MDDEKLGKVVRKIGTALSIVAGLGIMFYFAVLENRWEFNREAESYASEQDKAYAERFEKHNQKTAGFIKLYEPAVELCDLDTIVDLIENYYTIIVDEDIKLLSDGEALYGDGGFPEILWAAGRERLAQLDKLEKLLERVEQCEGFDFFEDSFNL